MITLTAYSNKNEKWDLTINGITPASLTLVDIAIEYSGTDDPIENPIYLPKFTFTFLGKKELYDDFGEIGNRSHQFNLVNGTNRWRGYLTKDVFSMPNTGFDAEFSINGISLVEALKYIPYEISADMTTLSYTRDVIDDIILNNAGVASIYYVDATHIFFPTVIDNCFCMNDDNNAQISMYEVLEWIASSLGIRIVLDWDNKVSVHNLVWLFQVGGDDYSLLAHAGIDETFETSDRYDSVIVDCKEARPEFVNLDFKLPEDRANELPQIRARQGEEKPTWLHSPERWANYRRYIGYFKLDQFEGWSFPKYNYNGSIPEWWNPNQIFTANGIPARGAYPMVYQQNDLGWEKAMIVIGQFGGVKPTSGEYYAEYKKKFIPTKGDYLSIDGSVINSFYSRSPASSWPVWADRKPFQIENEQLNEWEKCPVPLILRKGDEGDVHAWNAMMAVKWLYVSVKFNNKYWSPPTDSWVAAETKFEIEYEFLNNQNANDNAFQVPLPIKKKIDNTGEIDRYFESVSGYWIKLPEQYGELEIRFYFPTSANYYPTLLLPNIQISKINIFNDGDYVNRINKEYRCGRDDKSPGLSVKKYTVFLSSYKKDLFENFISTMWIDPEGTLPVEDNIQYYYRFPQGGSRSIEQRPEHHIARIALYYISGMKKITDILNIADRKLTFTYKGDKLWENGCAISPLKDIVRTTFCYNRTTYDG